MMSHRARRLPWMAMVPWLVVACGSRTPLLTDPDDDAPATLTQPGPTQLGPTQLGPTRLGSRRARSRSAVRLHLGLALDSSGAYRSVLHDRQIAVDVDEPSDDGPSRWETVSSALQTFIKAPLSEGLGAGIAFFPRTGPDGRG